MAKLYEIDQAILECIDAETGEILDFERLSELQMERDAKIENAALWYKNLLSDAEQYKVEKELFAERERIAKNQAEGLKKWLDLALGGEEMKTTKVFITYRKSESVEIEDDEKFVKYAQSEDRDDLLSYKDPTPNKTAIKKALKEGLKIDGVTLIKKQNINIK